jgi:hypothetical protein
MEAKRTALRNAFDVNVPLESFGLVNIKSGTRNPFKSMMQADGRMVCTRGDGFEMTLDLDRVVTCETPPVSQSNCQAMGFGPYPYPDVNHRTKFFIPSGMISCRLPDGTNLQCEGRVCFKDKEIRVDALDQKDFAWFWFVIGANCKSYC